MIERVPKQHGRAIHTRAFSFGVEWISNLSHQVFVRERGDGFVAEGEGALDVINHLILATDACRAVFAFAQIGGFFAQHRGSDFVQDRGRVHRLLRKRADALELAVAGRKRELVGRHGLNQRDELTLGVGQLPIENLAGRGSVRRQALPWSTGWRER